MLSAAERDEAVAGKPVAASLCLGWGVRARPVGCGVLPFEIPEWFPNNVARNSPAHILSFEIGSLKFRGFLDAYEKLGYPNYVRDLSGGFLGDACWRRGQALRTVGRGLAMSPTSPPIGMVPQQCRT